MKFAEVIVFDVLEKHGFTSPSMIRSTELCRWYTARKGDELFEVEAYDSQTHDSETMSDYLASLDALPESVHFRKPAFKFQERKITCIIRKYVEGEPLYSYFIRPGELPQETACDKIKNFEKIHAYLKENNLGNFAPISLMLFMAENGEVFIDGLKCGPWVKRFDHLTVISNYLNPELSWPQQINFFRNSFALKMLTGNPGTDKADKEFPKALEAFVTGIFSDKKGYDENLSRLEKKFRPKPKGFFLRVALITAVFILPLVAYLVRVSQSGSSWLGPAFTDKSDKKEENVERDEFAFEPDAEEKIEVSHEFTQRLKKIREMMLAGNFKSALDDINELSSINLRKGELELLKTLRTEYPEKRKEDFERAVSLSRTYLTQEKFNEAVAVMEDIVERYQKGSDTEQAMAAIVKIKELESSQEAKEKEDIMKKSASLEKDKLMIKKMEELQNVTMRKPSLELNALNKRLGLIRLECVTEAAKYLVSCTIKQNEAEKRLFEQLLQIQKEDEKKKILKFLSDNVTGLGGVEVYDIIESGIEYRDATGGGNFKFSNIPPDVMYKVFKETSVVDVERAPYYLYLYCHKYGLVDAAGIEFKNIKSSELLKDADSLRDMKQARRDLFAKSN